MVLYISRRYFNPRLLYNNPYTVNEGRSFENEMGDKTCKMVLKKMDAVHPYNSTMVQKRVHGLPMESL